MSARQLFEAQESFVKLEVTVNPMRSRGYRLATVERRCGVQNHNA
jgi:hypothetical protein